MKKILLLFTTLFFISCSVHKNKTDWHKDGLNEKVKVIQDRTFLVELNEENKIIKGKEIGGIFIGNQKKFYNKKGLVTEKIIFHENNKSIDTHQKFKYNRTGICIKKTELYSNGDVKSESTFKFKRKSNIIEGEWFDLEGTSTSNKVFLKFDKRGNLIKDNNIEYKYDENNNLIESVLFYPDTNYKLITNYTLDSLQHIIKLVQNTSFREITRELTYTLDQNENWIEKIEYQEGEPKYIIERSIEYY